MQEIVAFVSRDSAIEMAYKPRTAYFKRCQELGLKKPKGFFDPKIRNVHPYIARRARSAARFINLLALMDVKKTRIPDEDIARILGIDCLQRAIENGFPPLLSFTRPNTDLLKKYIRNLDRIILLDPMAGGGTIPLEGALMGLETHAIDYNSLSYILMLATILYPQQYGQKILKNLESFFEALKSKVLDILSKLYDPNISADIVTFAIPKGDIMLVMENEFKVLKNKIIKLPYKKMTNKTIFVKKWFQLQKNLISGLNKDLLRAHLFVGQITNNGKFIENTCDGFYQYQIQSLEMLKEDENKSLLREILRYAIPKSNTAYNSLYRYGCNHFVLLMNPRQLVSLLTILRIGFGFLRKIEDKELRKAITVYFALFASKLWNFNNILTTWNYNTKTLRDSTSSYYRSRKFTLGREYAEGNLIYRQIDWVLELNNEEKSGGGIFPILKLLADQLSLTKNNIIIRKYSALHLLDLYNPETFDIINVDPPYGEIHSYSDFSEHFLWIIHYVLNKMGFDDLVNYPAERSEEIIATKKESNTYFRRIEIFLKQCYHVLKTNGVLAIWFNHRDPKVWRKLVQAIRKAGFYIHQIIPLVSEHPTRIIAKGKSKINRILVIFCKKAQISESIQNKVNEFIELLKNAKIMPRERITQQEIEFYKAIVTYAYESNKN